MSEPVIDVEYEQPTREGAVCSTQHAWARVPPEPSPAERLALKTRIRALLREKNAVMVSHYYVHPDLQDLAEETGGLVSDSLEMARFGRDHPARTLVVSGVRFMGETAKILSPEKTVLMPDLDATCSLDLGCPILVGHSRKGFLTKMLRESLGREPTESERDVATADAARQLAASGVQIVSVHAVGTVRASLDARTADRGVAPNVPWSASAARSAR